MNTLTLLVAITATSQFGGLDARDIQKMQAREMIMQRAMAKASARRHRVERRKEYAARAHLQAVYSSRYEYWQRQRYAAMMSVYYRRAVESGYPHVHRN